MNSKIHKVVVIGAGVMGHGISQVLATKGIKVTLVDANEQSLATARGWIGDNLAYMGQLGLIDADTITTTMGNIQYTTQLAESLAGAQHVLEAVSENREIKRAVWRFFGEHAEPDAILSSNTSSYDINDLADGVPFPERIIGTHWFHPPPITPCVEVIPGNHASQENIDLILNFLDWLGKAPTICKSAPGFVANRIQMALTKEAIAIIEEGLATPAEVDRIVKTSLGFRLGAFGPIEIIDMAGIDTFVSIFEYLNEKLPGDRFKTPPILNEMNREGRRGLKVSRGFYDYQSGAADIVRRKRDRKLYRRLTLFREELESEKE